MSGVELIDRLSATGVKRIEAVSFVNPKRVPQMAAAEDVMAGVKRPDGVTFVGLALNLRGVERAIGAGVDEVRYVVVASETFNRKNQGSSIDDTLRSYRDMAGSVTAAGLRLSAVVARGIRLPVRGRGRLEQGDGPRPRTGWLKAHRTFISPIRSVPPSPNQVAERIAATRDRCRRRGDAGMSSSQHAQYGLRQRGCGRSGGCPAARLIRGAALEAVHLRQGQPAISPPRISASFCVTWVMRPASTSMPSSRLPGGRKPLSTLPFPARS